ncbi:glycerophosphodiester phosphodiesterase family protein [Methyloversatilis thermotolerans]|uniref:glycerophosphodiester phosphodiesterase family protein n=1 Tax=Methyloversatilis thermotolerans TaxID=1346290 RepID=UPI00037F7D35|nr:glycerophosphodiester phosphodiesterase family protein [Methyloversatilis thermotolerans]
MNHRHRPLRPHLLAALMSVCIAGTAQAAGNAAAYASSVLASDPLAYWQLDAVAGQLSGVDASGNGLNATPLGSGSLVSGLFGGAAAGGGNYLKAPSIPSLTGSNAVTIEAWIKLDAPLGSIGESFAGIYDSSQDHYALYLDRGNGELRFKVTTANGYAERPGASSYIVNKKQGEWIHVVGMLDPNDAAGASAKIYVDGVLRDRHTAAKLASTLPAGQAAAIAADWNAGKPNRLYELGGVDQVAIYDRALSESEIRSHFELGSGRSFIASAPRPTSVAEGFEVIAHRGNSMFAPENTLESNRQAIALGADRFETDVWVTKDGIAVNMHDGTTTRTTGVNRSIANSTLAELEALSAGYSDVFGDRYAGEKIPTLVETLTLARDAGAKVVLDTKDAKAGAAIARAVEETGFDLRNAVAFGWSDASVADLVTHLDGAEVFHLGFFSTFVARGSLDARGDYLDALKAAGVDGLALSFADLLSQGEPLWGDLLALAESRELRVFTWTVNEAETMADLMSMSATRVIDGKTVVGRLSGIITDDPATALALVSSVPEPGSWAMFLLGGAVLLMRRRR